MESIWNGLKKFDTDNDDKVSADEWVAMWKDVVEKGINTDDWQKAYIDYMFVLLDQTGDDKIDKNEYVAVMKMFAVDEPTATKAFEQLKTPTIDKATFQHLWKEYFQSTEKEKPGNYLFPGAI